MNTYLDCMPCYVRQALDAVRLATDEVVIQEKVLREILQQTAVMDRGTSTVAMGQRIHRLVRELTGRSDPYRELKDRFNNLALSLMPEMRRLVAAADNPLETAVRLAIAGNIIDFGVNAAVEDSHLHESIEFALKVPLLGDIDVFAQAVSDAESILYLADNTGEIVFDSLLVEMLENVTVAVRGGPVINDATMCDAEVAGLTKITRVIDNGNDAPGTILDDCSPEFQQEFEKASLVIAKGQGNYESLIDNQKHIAFLLRAKCNVISHNIGCDLGSFVLRMR
jgi:uncharacterized protein with ATP-grasp and redox domains